MEETNHASKPQDEDGYVFDQHSLCLIHLMFKRQSPPCSRSRRRRKTEKEEDEEILKDEGDEGSDLPTVFTESPKCRLLSTGNGSFDASCLIGFVCRCRGWNAQRLPSPRFELDDLTF